MFSKSTCRAPWEPKKREHCAHIRRDPNTREAETRMLQAALNVVYRLKVPVPKGGYSGFTIDQVIRPLLDLGSKIQARAIVQLQTGPPRS